MIQARTTEVRPSLVVSHISRNGDEGVNGLRSASRHGSSSRAPNALDPVCRNGRPYSLDKDLYYAANKETKSVALGSAYGSLRRHDDCFAHPGDSGVGRLLSLEMSFSVGGVFLFFSRQLLDHWQRGRSSPTDLAFLRASRGPYRNADVRHVRERTFRYPDPNFGG